MEKENREIDGVRVRRRHRSSSEFGPMSLVYHVHASVLIPNSIAFLVSSDRQIKVGRLSIEQPLLLAQAFTMKR